MFFPPLCNMLGLVNIYALARVGKLEYLNYKKVFWVILYIYYNPRWDIVLLFLNPNILYTAKYFKVKEL